jgi:hypothetical protein
LEAIKPEGVLPINGIAVYAYEGHTIRGQYKIRNGDVKFRDTWAAFCMDYSLYGGVVLVTRVVANESYIGLDILRI